MWLCRKTTLLFHEATSLRDEETLFRHDATWFGSRKTLVFPGNTLFRHEDTCFRGGVKSFRESQKHRPTSWNYAWSDSISASTLPQPGQQYMAATTPPSTVSKCTDSSGLASLRGFSACRFINVPQFGQRTFSSYSNEMFSLPYRRTLAIRS